MFIPITESVNKFQFQYGTIKSGQKLAVSAIFLFQFQYGTIKTLHLLSHLLFVLYFNSNMVQLKLHSENYYQHPHIISIPIWYN